MKSLSIISKNIKAIINERGLKQNAVAEWAGYSESQFSNLLNGRKVITDKDVYKLCKALCVTPNDLFATDDKAS